VLSLFNPGHPFPRFADTTYVARYSPDDLPNAVAGFTDAKGNFTTTDSTLFPCLYRLPTLNQTDAYGPTSVGTFHYSNEVVVVISDTGTGQFQFDTMAIAGGQPNVDTIIWNPSVPVPNLIGQSRSETLSPTSLRGDLNCNGVAYEIDDAYTYRDFFLYGFRAFDSVQCSADGSDIDADGLSLTVADFIYLIRIFHGETPPLEKPTLLEHRLDIAMYDTLSGCAIRSLTNVSVGGFLAVFRRNAVPQVLVEGMEVVSYFNGDYSMILVYPPISGVDSTHGFGAGTFLYLAGVSAHDAWSMQAAGRLGTPLQIYSLPAVDRLYQNFPNPF